MLTAADVAIAYEQLAGLRHTAAAFFDQGFDLLACPTTQVAPFPVEWEYPTVVAGREMSDYIDWMASCWRITVTGCPTLSLPAGFDADGLPVGVQLVARHGADVDLLRAAKAAGDGDRTRGAATADHPLSRASDPRFKSRGRAVRRGVTSGGRCGRCRAVPCRSSRG